MAKNNSHKSAKTIESIQFEGRDVTVKEVIEALQKFNPEAILVGKADNFELHGAHVPASMIMASRMVKIQRSFRDAFDGEIYEKEIFRGMMDRDDESKAVDVVFVCL